MDRTERTLVVGYINKQMIVPKYIMQITYSQENGVTIKVYIM